MLTATLIGLLSLIPTNPSILSSQLAHAAQIDPLTSTTSIAAYVEQQAEWNGVSPDLALFVAGHEGFFVATSTGDMNIICHHGPNAGKPVRAKGVWQITDCYHSEVSDGEAFSVESATAWAIPLLKDKKTCQHEWTQCRVYYGQ